jgi:hypothetical protein
MIGSTSLSGRVVGAMIGQERLRAGACLLMLVGLLAWGVPIWMATVLPIAAYAGGWLVIASNAPTTRRIHVRLERRRRSHFTACRQHANALRLIVETSDEPDVVDRIVRIRALIDQSLDVLAEEERRGDAVAIYPLVETGTKLLNAYRRLNRRGFGSEAARAELLERLDTIELALNDAWFRINRDAMVNMRTLSASVDLMIGFEHP